MKLKEETQLALGISSTVPEKQKTSAQPRNDLPEILERKMPERICRSGYCLWAKCQKDIRVNCPAHLWAVAEYKRLANEPWLQKLRTDSGKEGG